MFDKINKDCNVIKKKKKSSIELEVSDTNVGLPSGVVNVELHAKDSSISVISIDTNVTPKIKKKKEKKKKGCSSKS